MTDQKIERVNYNGKEYLIKDLTEPMKKEFSLLLSIQGELNKLGELVTIQQRAQKNTTEILDAFIEEAGLEEAPALTTVEDAQLEEAHELIEKAE
tara:strand:+ start:201 stop:485 length:285 start_codon:yes stop_codon:yes gene_type:complete